MCRTTQVFCGSLVVFLLSSYTTAMAPSWLSAVSFKCDGENDVCAGALIGEQWILTTASCFQNCNRGSLRRFRAFLNIPDRNRRRVSIKSGTKVFVEDVWIHPSYDSITFANNLALVKLKCHDLNLSINVDFKKINCSIPLDCFTQTHSGYLHSSRNRFLRFRERNWEINSEGNVILSHCSVALSTDTIYYCANQPVAVSSDKISECAQQQRIIPATLICHHSEWITSAIQDNKATCASPIDALTPTDISTSIPDESTDTSTPATTSTKESASASTPDDGSPPTDTPISTTSTSTLITVNYTEPSSTVTAEPLVVVPAEPIEVHPIEIVTVQPTEGVTSQPTEGVTSQPTEGVTSQPTEGETPQHVIISTTSSPTNDGCVLKIDNGEAIVTHNFDDGATLVIDYTCNTGYHFSLNQNKLTRICINGTMSSKPPPCEAITCPPFEPIANGRIEVTGLTYSSVARFICDPGYYITGSAIRSCDTDGEWNGIVGICKRKCTVPQSIRCNDGAQVYPTKTAFADIGDVVQYSVPNGYALIGSNPVCQPDSTWSPSPNCLKLCDESQNVPDAVVTVNRDIKSYTRNITCNDGYKPDGSDGQTCYRGTWTPLFRSCKRLCSDITLANGTTTMLGDQFAQLECDQGFHLDPPLVLITCKEGTWTPYIPTCIPDQ